MPDDSVYEIARRAPASRRSPPPWPRPTAEGSAQGARIRSSASFRSSRMRPARSEWTLLPDREDLQPHRAALHLGGPRTAAPPPRRARRARSPRRHQRGRGVRGLHRAPERRTRRTGEPLIPVYVFYSIFGFQRTGDAMWAAGDQMARGFIIGATAGRTTLTGEGLQHADGHSHLIASTNPAVVAYDPAYGYEIGSHRAPPASSGCTAATHRTRTSCTTSPSTTSRSPAGRAREPRRRRRPARHLQAEGGPRSLGPKAQLLASGVGVPWALEAQKLLADDWNIGSGCVERHPGEPSCAAMAWLADEHNFLHPTAPAGADPLEQARGVGRGP